MKNSRFKQFIFSLAATVAISAAPLTQAAQFGHTATDSSPSSGLSGDFKRGSRFALAENGVLTTTSATLDGMGGPQSGFQSVSMVIYSDANGTPGVKLTESAALKINAQSPLKKYDFPMSAIPLPPGSYWLVIQTDGAAGGSTPGIIRDYGSSAASNWYGNADNFVDGASSPFGTGSTGTVELALTATYFPSSYSDFVGRATVAATPSGGLASNVKRGSSFQTLQSGRVYELSAYLDGKGGGTGSQKLRYALYTDAGGVPGSLLGQTDEVTVKAGQAGSWVSAPMVPVDIVGSRYYWIVIHTGDTAGIARDYGDGAANWYSNADTYADGASSSFGSGTSGTVTISAAAIFVPYGSPQTLGRTTIASTPSGGLSANFSRGSSFGGTGVKTNSVLTAFWAYVDGKGGGSGSQQARVTLYAGSGNGSIANIRWYQSEPVTIPAGMSARWVRFPLKAPALIGENPGAWLMLQTGDNAGVIRDYGDGAADWVGFADNFADGPAQQFSDRGDNGETRGTVTLSIYMEYTVPFISQ